MHLIIGWYFVSFDDEQGWVPSSHLESAEGGEGAQEEVTIETCIMGEYFLPISNSLFVLFRLFINTLELVSHTLL